MARRKELTFLDLPRSPSGMNGPGGKYEALCSQVRETTHAEGCVLIILDGENGNGFSVEGTAEVLQQLPTMLCSIADKIEKDLETAEFKASTSFAT